VWKRRCGCGAQLPTTVTRAARILMPACVNCERPLPESAGVMSDARIVISGGPAVGKTHLLLQAVAEMYRPDLLSPWEPADDQTAARLRDMDALAIRPLATSAEPIAASTTLMLRRTGNGWPHYLHIVDLDGRYFQTGMENSALWQLGETRRHLLVIDATVVPWVRDRIFSAAPHSEPSYPAWIETGVAAAELPYRLLVMQLNRMGARTRQCSLALVITKADVLAAYGVAPDLNVDEHSAEGLRAWLRKVELHNLVAASEHDFAEVRCFVMGDGREAPSAPFYWLMDQYPHGMSRP
jgi:Double-GTPase 2